jgi:hypothetical protein
MQTELHLDAETMERLQEQSRLLLRTYRIECDKDPTSHATESSHSHVIALRHTIKQLYGETAALALANELNLPTPHPRVNSAPLAPKVSYR